MYFVVLINAFAEITIRDAKVHFIMERKQGNSKNQKPNSEVGIYDY